MIKIGPKKIDTNIFLAPLSGCSDLAFRLISREHGAKFCFFEMVDSNCLVRGPRHKTFSILKTIEPDSPIAAQLLGNDPSVMLRAAREVMGCANISFLDINAACPAKKIIKKKAGSYLLYDQGTLSKIVKKLSSALSIPVTVKMRLGYEKETLKDILKFAKTCESSGAQAIFVHGRTRSQGYMGEVDYRSIKAIKDSVKIPVFGAGNILSPELAKKMLDQTGCDGILVARGALGNPWIFSQIEEYLNNGRTMPPVNFSVKKAVLKKHLFYVERYKVMSPSNKAGFMCKVATWYLRGFPKATRIRQKISIVKRYEEMIKLIDELTGP